MSSSCLAMLAWVTLIPTEVSAVEGRDAMPPDDRSAREILVEARPKIAELRRRTIAVLKRHATEGTEKLSRSVVYRGGPTTEPVLDMFVLLRSDPRWESSNALQNLSSRVRRRLLIVAQDEARRLKREGIEPPDWSDLETRVAESMASVREELDREPSSGEPSEPSEPGGRAAGDARRRTPGGGTQGGNTGGGGTGGGGTGDAGGPHGAFAGVGTAGGWELVTLIRRIVRPEFWQAAGGDGVICYFANRRVLVVRATTDVHQDVKDLLNALR